MAAFQVFWPQDGDYNERAVAGAHYLAGRWQRMVLELPPQPKHAVLRIDPCTEPGSVQFASIRITAWDNRTGGIRLRHEKDVENLHLEDLVLVPDLRCIGMVSLGLDPKCFLAPLPSRLSGRRLRLEVWVRFDPSLETALDKLRNLARHFARQRENETRLAQQEVDLQAERERCAGLEREVQAGKGLEETSRFLRAELAHVRAELDWVRNETDRLRKENERRKLALREAESTFQFRWTLPSIFTKKKRKSGIARPEGFEFNLESPKSWNLIHDTVTLIGWCFAKSDEFIQAIRASVGDKKYEGSYGRKRFDVHKVFPNYKNSDRSGFEIEVTDLPSRFTLTIEVLDDKNAWHTLATVEGRVAPSIWGLERQPRSGDGAELRFEQVMQLSTKEQGLLQKEIRAMTMKPVVSVIMPVYNTPADYLREAIQSVRSQIYPNWQLCIADDCSTNESTLQVLKEVEKSDPRILVHRCEKNGGIAAASNAALGIATGDMVALMDHDDLISPVALLRVAQASVLSSADFVYSDEGHISPGGDFLGGIYRPAFSLAYLQSHPYIVHLIAFSARLLHDIGGFNASLTISQDYDLILRAAERARNIVHIPEILYLWRQLPTSAGHQLQEKVMQTSAGILEEHSRRIDAACDVAPGIAFNFFKRQPKIDFEKSSTAIIILTKNQAALLRRCVETLEKTLPEKLPWKIVIVDHDSTDPETVELLAEYARRHTVVPYSGSFNYAALNNFGVRHGAGDAEYLLFCNNDIELTQPGWMERLLEVMADEKVGAAAPMMLYPDGNTVQHAGVSVGLCGPAEHLGKFLVSHEDGGKRLPGYQGMMWVNREVAAITTACALFRRRAYEAVGGFNEEFQVGFNDTDLCLRIWQQDYRVVYCGETFIIHHESASRGKSFTHDPHPADSRRFFETWGWLISKGDPFYNPNLRSDSTSWESAFISDRTAKPKLRRYTSPASMFTK